MYSAIRVSRVIAGPDLAAGSAVPRAPAWEQPSDIRIRITPTSISGAWIAAIIAVVALAFLLIFIVQNLTRAHVYFLGATGTLPMGVAMLFAAFVGMFLIALIALIALVALVGLARVPQPRRAAHRRRY